MRRALRLAMLCAAFAACARAASAPTAEACAWSAGGGGGGAGCDAAAAADALRALHAELDAADARLDAERARLDAAAARVAALRSALACGGADGPLEAASGSSHHALVAVQPPAAPGAPGWAYRHAVAARPQPGWAQRLPLLAALRLPPPAHVTALLTLPPELSAGAPPRLIAVGDSAGRVFVFTPGGALLAQAPPGGRGAVTALAAAPVRRNETALMAGHACGRVALHFLEEAGPTPWLPPAANAQPLDDDTGAPRLPALSLRELWSAAVAAGDDDDSAEASSSAAREAGPRGREVTLLEALPFAAGRVFVAADAGGGLAAFEAPSPSRAAAASSETSTSPPASWRAAAPRPVRALRGAAGGGGDARAARRVLFVSDGGIGTLDLPPGGAASASGGLFRAAKASAAAAAAREAPPALRAADCKGLNGTKIAAARFENSASSKFWAVSSAGEVLTVAAGFAGAAPLCTVRARRPLPRGADGAAPAPPFALAGLAPGYLVASSAAQLAVYDTSPPPRAARATSSRAAPQQPPGPRLVLAQSRGALAAPFAGMEAASGTGGDALPGAADSEASVSADSAERGALLAAAPRGSLLLVALGGGLVGVFENALHAPAGGAASRGGAASAAGAPPWTPRDLWGQPLFVIAVVLIAFYQFRAASAGGGAFAAFGGGSAGAAGRNNAAARAERRAAAAAAAAMVSGRGDGDALLGQRTFPQLAPRPIGGGDDDAALRRALSAFEAYAQQDDDDGAPAE